MHPDPTIPADAEDPYSRLRALIPRPVSVEPAGGVVELPAELAVRVESDGETDAALRALELLPIRMRPAQGAVQLRVSLTRELPTEGYVLDTAGDPITVEAGSTRGLVHAVQTLRQLLPTAAFRTTPPLAQRWTAARARIADGPSLGWRGLLLDVARHFLPVREVLRHIDAMSVHKLNTLHLHLVNDQGWRIASRRFPRLEEVAAWRPATQVNHYAEAPELEHTPHGGCYTAEDLAEIVEHAAARGIDVVPEITVPGHTSALLAAYPELGSPRDAVRQVATTWGVHDALLAPTAETLAFLGDLFAEVLPIFGAPYVHLGGDESVLRAWEDDPAALEVAHRRGLHGPEQLLAAFLGDVAGLLAPYGRRPVTWDDAFAAPSVRGHAGLPADTVVMAWRGTEVARRAAAAGHDVVLAPVMPTYFDYFQAADADEPLAIGGPITWDDVASWDPVPATWTPDERARVLGVQCQLWTELVPDARTADYLLYPRTAAFSEIAWTGAPARGLEGRLPVHLRRLDAAGIEYRPLEGPRPWQRAGTGRRAHRSGAPMADRVARYETAAATGEVADASPRPAASTGSGMRAGSGDRP